MKRLGKVLLCFIAALLALALLYVAYVFIAGGSRIGNAFLTVEGASPPHESAKTDTEYTVTSYNIGFGAYESDYGFFMDGGTQSWAWSKERLEKNLRNITSFLSERKSDFYLLQEVDLNATRSYHVDERRMLMGVNSCMWCTWAQNYNSPFLLYPFSQPHGASESGLMTMSGFAVTRADRVELPIEKGPSRVLDLDRCYSVHRITVENGKDLVLYNLHLSAYTSDGTIATEQLRLLLADMDSEYEKGNYCVAGGDFNKDLLGNAQEVFGAADREYTWAQPIPAGTLEDFQQCLVVPFDEENPVPSCRNADGPYHAGQYVLTVDGFLISANVELLSSCVVDLGFAYSDHNPVQMSFKLKP